MTGSRIERAAAGRTASNWGAMGCGLIGTTIASARAVGWAIDRVMIGRTAPSARIAPGWRACIRATITLATSCLLLAGCATQPTSDESRLADREAIEDVLARANLGFELSDADLFANAFADDAVFELNGTGPVFGYSKMTYTGRADIRTIVGDRVEKARTTDPKTLSYDPATLRRYNRNSDSRIEVVDPSHARHWSTWMVVMKTNVNIHISAVGRYEDTLEKRSGKWLIVKRRRIE